MSRFSLFFLTFSVIFTEIYADPAISCPTGFKLINQNKCLKVYPNHLKHQEAEMTCTGFGGTLVTVKTAIDNRAVVNMAANAGASYTWLGMFCFGNDTSTCYHDDGTGNPTYSSFQAGFPKVDASTGGCVYMATTGKTAGQWVTGQCQVSNLSFICEVPTTLANPACTHNYNGYCYIPSHEMPGSFHLNKTDFQEALVNCEEFGGKLASVHSKQEVDFIRGIYTRLNLPHIYLGGKTYIGQTFEWVDDTRWDYDYTDPIASSNGSCLQMDTSDRPNNLMWSRVDCEEQKYFLCKRPIEAGLVFSQQGTKVAEKGVNPKLKFLSADATSSPDFSHCNSTIYLGPGTVTSFGYPLQSIPSYCTWKIAVLGPYRLGMYFTDFSVSSSVLVFDEYGRLLTSLSGTMAPFQVLAPTNMARITHYSNGDLQGGYRGFKMEILPY